MSRTTIRSRLVKTNNQRQIDMRLARVLLVVTDPMLVVELLSRVLEHCCDLVEIVLVELDGRRTEK